MILGVFITGILSFAVIWLVWHHFFSIYEIRFEITPGRQCNSGDTVLIAGIPLNSRGNRAPFRSVSIEYTIDEGDTLISNIVRPDIMNLEFFCSGGSGKLILLADSDYLLATNKIEIIIN